MKTVLVPTDFDLESLTIIDALALTNPSETLNIVLMHAFKISDSISDLLMLGRRSKDYEHVSDEFYTQMNLYMQKYKGKIERISIQYFYGNTVAAFRNFIENLEVSYIAYPIDYQFNALSKYSIDPRTLISRSKCDVLALATNDITAHENLYETKMPEEQLQGIVA